MRSIDRGCVVLQEAVYGSAKRQEPGDAPGALERLKRRRAQ